MGSVRANFVSRCDINIHLKGKEGKQCFCNICHDKFIQKVEFMKMKLGIRNLKKSYFEIKFYLLPFLATQEKINTHILIASFCPVTMVICFYNSNLIIVFKYVVNFKLFVYLK